MVALYNSVSFKAFAGAYTFKIPSTLSLVPKIKTITPKMETRMFFQRRHFPGPSPSSQKVTHSMKHGRMMPKMEKQRAPMSPMKGPMVGTATARRTETKNLRYVEPVYFTIK